MCLEWDTLKVLTSYFSFFSPSASLDSASKSVLLLCSLSLASSVFSIAAAATAASLNACCCAPPTVSGWSRLLLFACALTLFQQYFTPNRL